MINPSNQVFHVLSVPRRDAENIEARGTVRVGTIVAGDTLWFETPEGGRRELNVQSVEIKSRYVLLNLQGDRESLESLLGGQYLYGA